MMPKESDVGDTTVEDTCRKQISCKCKWRYSGLVVHFCSMQRWVCSLQTGPLCPEALRRWGSPLPCEQENETLHLHEQQLLTQWLHHWPLMQKWCSTVGRKRQWRQFLCCLLWSEKYPLLGRAVRWMATTVAGQEREGEDGSWLQNCSGGLHLLERPCGSSGHGTWNTALLRLLAGNREVSHSLFGRR